MNTLTLILASFFIFSADGTNAVGALRTALQDELKGKAKSERIAAGWFDYVSTAPVAQSNEVVVCTGFIRSGDYFTGVYDVRQAPEPEPLPSDLKYYTTDLIAAIGSVLGPTRYDAVKNALTNTRTDGTPLWDMFVSGMYIPVNDPRLAAAKESLVGAELMTAEEFDRILATAGASDEAH